MELKKYFINTKVFIEGNPYLRDVQKKAYFNLKKDFEVDKNNHKIVVLPTGTGKTGVIGLAPYGVCEGRVLIITPSLIIREGISDEFDTRTTLNFWANKKVIFDEDLLPKVYRYAGYNTPSDKKRILSELNDSNIIIANIHKVYNENSNKTLVDILDPNFFDMIIIDEAHHSAADTWENSLDYFNCKKIIKLTATPYRADTRELKGKIVYSYPLSDAIKDKVIKNVVSEDYTTEKLEFEIDGKAVSKEEALKIMDSGWLTRTVAYSENCSRTIVKKSIDRLNEKRKHGNAFHQIIAVACGIEHAKKIKELYEEYGMKADYVSSDRMEESEKVIIAYKKGELDVVVNVDMLGEGFDNPQISIAAIFRPFRSLAPYAQFIGRALRKINEDNVIDEIDNVAHVVYHKELDLEELWRYYTKEFKKASTKKEIETEIFREEYEQNREVGNVNTGGNVIENIQTFLNDYIDKSYSNAIKNEIDIFENKLKNDINILIKNGIMDENTIKDFEKARRKSLDEKVNQKREERRKELIREELQKKYREDIINRVSCLFEDKGVSSEGNELPTNSTNNFLKNSKDNKAYVIKKINFEIKRKLKRGIDEWETYDFNEAQKLVPIIVDNISKKIDKIGGK